MDAKIAREPDQQQKLSYYKALNDIGNQIHAAKDINEILINLREEILSLFDADRITIYVVDGKRKEVYSRFAAGTIQEIRVPINNKSLAGYTANNAQITNIVNAYDAQEVKLIDRELGFDKSWDEKTKYMTKQILTVPIFYKKYVIGVLQLINKKGGDRFSLEDQNSAVEMAKVLGIAFFNQKKMAQQRVKRTKFDYLIDNNIITESELENAISMARSKNVSIESIFLERNESEKRRCGPLGRPVLQLRLCPL